MMDRHGKVQRSRITPGGGHRSCTSPPGGGGCNDNIALVSRAERWLPVVGYEGYYEVSSLGRVRSIARVIPHRRYGEMRWPGGLLKPYKTAKGYLMVCLSRDSKSKMVLTHRLVLAAFVGPCPVGAEGCHNDGNKTNNTVTNLRWDSRSANMMDQVRHGAHHLAGRTHCKQGHPYSAENTYKRADGHRGCRKCMRFHRRRTDRNRRERERRNRAAQ